MNLRGKRKTAYLFIIQKKNPNVPCNIGGGGQPGSCIHSAPRAPRSVFLLEDENTRTHGRSYLQLSAFFSLLAPSTLTRRVALSILSQSSSSRSSSPLPPPLSGVASRRSELEFGPSSPHHQSGKYAGNNSLLAASEFLALFSLARAQIIMLGKMIFFPFGSFEPKRPKLLRSSPQISGAAVAFVWYGHGLK